MKWMIKIKKTTVIKIIVMFVLIFIEAVVDIQLAQGVANVINIGLVKKGIDKSIPFFIEEKYMNIIEKYLDQNNDLKKYYIYVSKTEKDVLENYGISVSKNVYVFNEKEHKDIDAQKTIKKIIKPIVASQNEEIKKIINSRIKEEITREEYDNFLITASSKNVVIAEQYIPKELRYEIIELLQEKSKEIDDTVVDQTINEINKILYKDLGIDIEKISKEYVNSAIEKLLILVIIEFISQFVSINMTVNISNSISTKIKSRLTNKILNISSEEVAKVGKTKFFNIMTNNANKFEEILPIIIKEIIYSPIIIIYGLAIIIGKTNFTVALVIILSIIISVIISAIFLLIISPKLKANKKIEEETYDKINNIMGGITIIRSFLREKYEEKKIKELTLKSKKKYVFINQVLCSLIPILILVLAILLGILYLESVKLIDNGLLKIGDLVQIFQLSILVISALFGMVVLGILLPILIHSYNEIKMILKIPDEERTRGNEIFSIKDKDINFQNVSLEKNGIPILNNINICIKSGKINAVIGKNGSGKTSLINILLQDEKATSGKILIGNENLDDLSKESLKKLISIVAQENYIFSGTVESNLKLANPNIEPHEMQESLKIASIDDLAPDTNNVLKIEIISGGINLSGGQKQRVSIANAIARNSELLILDDSFSSLDTITAKNIRENIRKKYSKKTVLIISQKISDVRNADNIIVMDNGKIVAEGNHEYLKKKCDLYKDFINTQIKEGI